MCLQELHVAFSFRVSHGTTHTIHQKQQFAKKAHTYKMYVKLKSVKRRWYHERQGREGRKLGSFYERETETFFPRSPKSFTNSQSPLSLTVVLLLGFRSLVSTSPLGKFSFFLIIIPELYYFFVQLGFESLVLTSPLGKFSFFSSCSRAVLLFCPQSHWSPLCKTRTFRCIVALPPRG